MSIPARLDEAHGVEGDLPDETVVGYHHGHGAEQSLGVEGWVAGGGVRRGISRGGADRGQHPLQTPGADDVN